MAIFQDNRELSKQERFIGMDKVKGFKKSALSVMGYKDTGERNAWGKTGIPGMMGMGFGRLAAKGLTKGTDANKVMKKTDDEWLSTGIAKGKFIYESGKLAAKLIAGGMGGGAGGEVAKARMGNTATTATTTSGIGSDIVGSEGGNLGNDLLGSDIATSTAGENLTNQIANQSIEKAKNESFSDAEKIAKNKTDGELLSSIGDSEDEYMIDSSGNKVLKKDSTVDVEDQTLEEIEAAKKLKKEEQYKKTTKMLDKVPLIGGVASSGLELIAAQKNYTQEAKKEAQVFKEMTAKDSRFNLL